MPVISLMEARKCIKHRTFMAALGLVFLVWLLEPLIGFFVNQDMVVTGQQDDAASVLSKTILSILILLYGLLVSLVRIRAVERRATAKALMESEERFRLVCNQQLQFTAILSPGGVVLAINDLPLKSQGVARGDYIGKPFWESPTWAGLPEWQKIIKARIKQARRMRESLFVDDVYTAADGSLRTARACYTPIHTPDGKLQYILVEASDTTEHRETERLLQDSDERMRLAIKAMSMGTWDWDIQTDSVMWSEETLSIFGVNARSFEGTYQGYANHIAPESRDKLDEYIKNFLQDSTGSPVIQYEHEVIRGDGSRGWVEVRGTLFRDDDGTPKRMTGICLDITERKKVEAQLRDSEARYRSVVEDTPVLICSFQASGKITFVNKTYCTYFDKPFEELVGINFTELVPTPDRETVWHNIEKLDTSNPILTQEHPVMAPGGKIQWQRWTNRAIYSNDGKLIEYHAIGEDITERKIAEEALRESELRLKEIIWSANVGTWEWNIRQDSIWFNERFADILGYTKDELTPITLNNWSSLIHPEDRKASEALLHKMFDREVEYYERENRMRHKNGSWVWVLDRGKVVEWDDTGNPVRMSGTSTDITSKKSIELELEHRTRRLIEGQTALIQLAKQDFHDLQHAFTEIIRTDAQHLGVDRVSVWLFSEDRSEISCQLLLDQGRVQDIGVSLSRQEHPRYFQAIEDGLIDADDVASDPRTSELRLGYLSINGIRSMMDVPIRIQGQTVGIVCHEHKRSKRNWPVEDVDFANSIAEMCSVVMSSHERKKAREQLTYQASHDPLTNLPNRFEFERRAKKLITDAQQFDQEHVMCFLDLDQFKVVNDTCGHTAGDELLRQIAQLLLENIRKMDTLARLGGDEFGILIAHCNLGYADRIANHLLKAIQDFQFNWEGHTFRIGVSIGVVPITSATGTFSELLKQADVVCYMAKDLGRNRIHVYHPEDEELARRHGEILWVNRINEALKNNLFCLYAQPIVSLTAQAGKHFELLLRMRNKSGDIIPPGAFLPAAERYNLVSELDQWVIRNAFETLAASPVFFEQIDCISINLSGLSLLEKSMLDFILRQSDRNGIELGKICFEITETAAIANLNMAKQFISRLRDTGCQFALDDFGSGLSSFGYLKNLDVQYLKIDGMFVRNIVTDPIDRAMVHSINEIGQVMGVQTIAEFVETPAIMDMLRTIGVDYAQGYGVGKPVPLETIIEQTVEAIARPTDRQRDHRALDT